MFWEERAKVDYKLSNGENKMAAVLFNRDVQLLQVCNPNKWMMLFVRKKNLSKSVGKSKACFSFQRCPTSSCLGGVYTGGLAKCPGPIRLRWINSVLGDPSHDGCCRAVEYQLQKDFSFCFFSALFSLSPYPIYISISASQFSEPVRNRTAGLNCVVSNFNLP